MIYFQILLDTVIMLVLCFSLAGQAIRFEKNTIIWFICFHILCLILRYRRTGNAVWWEGFDANNFDLLPVNNPILLLVLLMCVLMLNSSLIYSISNMKVIVVTFLSFLIWILLRTFSIAGAGLIMAQDSDVFSYIHRGITLLLALMLYLLLITKRGSFYLGDYSGIFPRIMLVQSAVVVLCIVIYANFETSFVTQNLLLILLLFTLVISMNLWIIYEHHKQTRQEKRVSAIEQYLPVIDELVSEVRARQHEFHNKLLAIHSIVETAPNLPEARAQISAYTDNVIMQSEIREVLQLDSKVIGGFLYTKMRIAEQRKITLTPVIHVSFGHIVTEEHQLVEILGVLIDNAIEASFPEDEIIVTVQRTEKEGLTEISVMNPGPPKSSTDFIQMFNKGYTTKNTAQGSRGYGLYNVKQIVLQHKGRLITRNTEYKGITYLSIGVLIP
ncbi:sensor histidine kinase [Paenibacillus lemnae]|uniref:GHKL domain-containing protein n=1 Tax=Paenibacillus lemnae TaxID=1330551 RepID=A0A848M688_PAELE|nr:ATP-binding protein [Paenibacillus lemnae]NMO95769.1 GHKL domain-containing protein [Paenibacillus lemnae]